MSDIKNDNLLNLTGAYVLHALSQDEVEYFEKELANSEQARNEVVELSDTAVMLGLAIEPVKPSDKLKANLMAQVAVTPQFEAKPEVSAVPNLIVVSEAKTKATVEAKKRWFQKPILAGIPVAIAASMIVVAAVSGNVSGVQQQTEANNLASISEASDNQKVNATVQTGGTATVMWSEEAKSSAVFLHDIAEIPSDKDYELWYISPDGTARAAGVLSEDSLNRGWQVLDGQMQEGDTVGVTVEQAGGVQQPTTSPVLLVETV